MSIQPESLQRELSSIYRSLEENIKGIDNFCLDIESQSRFRLVYSINNGIHGYEELGIWQEKGKYFTEYQGLAKLADKTFDMQSLIPKEMKTRKKNLYEQMREQLSLQANSSEDLAFLTVVGNSRDINALSLKLCNILKKPRESKETKNS